jgi:hypothetical protein
MKFFLIEAGLIYSNDPFVELARYFCDLMDIEITLMDEKNDFKFSTISSNPLTDLIFILPDSSSKKFIYLQTLP